MDKRTTAIFRRESPAPDLSHHERHCVICRHPDREYIEESFLSWRSPANIRCEFNIPSRTTIYRHARACGLFEQRSRNLRAALELIIEGAERVEPRAEGVIKAIRAYTKINSAGEWIEPPAHVIVSSGSALAARPAPAPALSGASDVPLGAALNVPALASGSAVPCGMQVESQNDEPPVLIPAVSLDAANEEPIP
jgi:hypothetical protein